MSFCFKERGYLPKVIKEGFKRTASSRRNDLLIPKRKPTLKPKVRLISSYNGRWREMRNAMQKHWGVLQLDPNIEKHIPDFPLITYRRVYKFEGYDCA